MLVAGGLLACGLAARAGSGQVPNHAGFGSRPVLPPAEKSLLPTVHLASAVGWQKGAAPVPASGLAVTAFASGLDHPRWIYILPNGDVLVAETDAPPRPDDKKSVRNRVMGFFMKKVGSGVSSANRITLLRDTDQDGVADLRSVFLANLHSPFGMALVNNEFYVANTDMVLRYPYETGATAITSQSSKVAELPGGELNHHWTKNLVASKDGRLLYVAVGSNSNIAENGLAAEKDRATILEIDPATGARRTFANGLRNPVGMAWQPDTGELWAAVNERDELGNDLVPDYMTSVRDGAFYGWPYSYFGGYVDTRVEPQRPDLVQTALPPDYALGAHTASLGLAYSRGTSLPERYADGMFVGQHGSWNRKPYSGYKVIFVPFRNGKPFGDPVDVLGGFLNGDGKAQGRPVGVALDKSGALLVADDVGNTIWRVTGQTAPDAPPAAMREGSNPQKSIARECGDEHRTPGAAHAQADPARSTVLHTPARHFGLGDAVIDHLRFTREAAPLSLAASYPFTQEKTHGHSKQGTESRPRS